MPKSPFIIMISKRPEWASRSKMMEAVRKTSGRTSDFEEQPLSHALKRGRESKSCINAALEKSKEQRCCWCANWEIGRADHPRAR